jgi:hypothetical protein
MPPHYNDIFNWFQPFAVLRQNIGEGFWPLCGNREQQRPLGVTSSRDLAHSWPLPSHVSLDVGLPSLPRVCFLPLRLFITACPHRQRR